MFTKKEGHCGEGTCSSPVEHCLVPDAVCPIPEVDLSHRNNSPFGNRGPPQGLLMNVLLTPLVIKAHGSADACGMVSLKIMNTELF